MEADSAGAIACFGGNPREKTTTVRARLSFTSDKRGSHLIGASRATGTPRLLYTKVGGKQICGWGVAFRTSLPSNTTTFYIHFGTSGSYWGPYGRSKARRVSIAYLKP
jgi:hypothetical protein